MQLLVIAGHGAGDPGACGNGRSEADMVRMLARRIKDLGGDRVILGDLSRNYYADNGISRLPYSTDTQIIELHMDSAAPSARGAHIIIKSGIGGPDDYDRRLADFLAGVFPGRSNRIVERSDLANPSRAAARGYGYRLAEVGFITNAGDVSKFLQRLDEIAEGILHSFGINKIEKVKEVEEMTPEEFWKYTISKKHGDKGKMSAEDMLAWIEFNTADAYRQLNDGASSSGDKTSGKPLDRIDWIDMRVREMYDMLKHLDSRMDELMKK